MRNLATEKLITPSYRIFIKAFDLTSVAEGIETQAQYEALLAMGCNQGQGFGIARPMPASALPNWARANEDKPHFFADATGAALS
jgi:EAL domain-containing protein (putative c-di-GMP-specific phosphodiesterase class I)